MQFITPCNLPVQILSNDKFGWRNLAGIGSNLHDGVDLRPEKDEIYAVESGSVVYSGIDQFGANYIDIQHAEGFKSRYVHNRQNLVKWGGSVEKGQLIGYIGNTGDSTGRHLHFGLFANGQAVDPEIYINFNQNPIPSIPEINQEIKKENMFKENLINSIKNSDLDDLTKKTNIQAVYNDDTNYLVAFLGSQVREHNKQNYINLKNNFLIKNVEINGNDYGRLQGLIDNLAFDTFNQEFSDVVLQKQDLYKQESNDLRNLIESLQTVQTPIKQDSFNQNPLLTDLLKSTESLLEKPKENVTINQALLGFSKWGGFDTSIYATLSVLLIQLPTIFPEINENTRYTAILTGVAGILNAFLKSQKQLNKSNE